MVVLQSPKGKLTAGPGHKGVEGMKRHGKGWHHLPSYHRLPGSQENPAHIRLLTWLQMLLALYRGLQQEAGGSRCEGPAQEGGGGKASCNGLSSGPAPQ